MFYISLTCLGKYYWVMVVNISYAVMKVLV